MIIFIFTILNDSIKGLKYPRSKAIYERTYERGEKINKIMQFAMVYASVPGYVEFKIGFVVESLIFLIFL